MGKMIQKIHEFGDGVPHVVDEREALNDYEALEGSWGNPTKVRFNGKVLELGQKVISNGTMVGFPAGTEIRLTLFDVGGDVWFLSDSHWVFGVGDNWRSFQGEPANFVGYEDTKRPGKTSAEVNQALLEAERRAKEHHPR